MSEFQIDIDQESLRRLRGIGRPSRIELVRSLGTVLEREAQFAAAVATRLATQRLRTRTGSLRRSIAGVVAQVDGLPAVQIGIYQGPALAYAAAQEFGATIRPVKGRALAIPVEGGPALTASGVERYGGPREFPEPLEFVPFTRGRAIGGLFRKADLDGDLADADAVYLLVAKSRIKAKRFLRDGMQQSLQSIARAVGGAIADWVVGRSGSRV